MEKANTKYNVQARKEDRKDKKIREENKKRKRTEITGRAFARPVFYRCFLTDRKEYLASRTYDILRKRCDRRIPPLCGGDSSLRSENHVLCFRI